MVGITKYIWIDDILAKLITAMTKEGKFKDAIQDRIGATVDTTDLDVTDTHYDKKYQICRDVWMLNMVE